MSFILLKTFFFYFPDIAYIKNYELKISWSNQTWHQNKNYPSIRPPPSTKWVKKDLYRKLYIHVDYVYFGFVYI